MSSQHALSPAGTVSVAPAWVQTTIVFALALSAFLVNLDQPLHFDELYHILAARSWSADGEMRIAEGVYTRGWLYTAFPGWWFSLFGDTHFVARLPSALAAGLWVAGVYLWVSRGGLWRNEAAAADEVADLIAARAKPVELPEEYDMRVYRWNTETESDPASCSKLPRIHGPVAARPPVVESDRSGPVGPS